ncbi:MAG TPA: peptidylprolyl isomerase [Rhodopila sp.]|jgi:parvulin-like peptidyl-prolyl isomerase|nr:peptidylprolyl isomerase [Rhodopila sp.]
MNVGLSCSRALLAFGLLVCATAARAAEPGSMAAVDATVARRGSVTLTAGDVRNLLARLDPAERDRLQHNPTALDAFVREQVLRQALLEQAHDAKWDQKPEIAAQAMQARDAVIVSTYLNSVTAPDPNYPSDADIRAAYEANKTRFLIPRQDHLAQIYIAVPADAHGAAAEEPQKKLEGIRRQLMRPHADFGALARATSQDKLSAQKGGDLGWARADQIVPQIRDAIAELPAGGVTDPIRTQDGWHLVKLLETKPASTAPLADVKAALIRVLRQQRETQAIQAYVGKMQSTEPVQINEIQLTQALTK